MTLSGELSNGSNEQPRWKSEKTNGNQQSNGTNAKQNKIIKIIIEEHNTANYKQLKHNAYANTNNETYDGDKNGWGQYTDEWKSQDHITMNKTNKKYQPYNVCEHNECNTWPSNTTIITITKKTNNINKHTYYGTCGGKNDTLQIQTKQQ